MNYAKLKLRPAEALILPAGDADTLLAAGNGDAALLYLHILRSGGTPDLTRAATELHRSDRDIETAARRLREMGLLTETDGEDAPAAPLPAAELPEYQARDVVARSMQSPEFLALSEAASVSLGRVLSSADIKKLFGIYDEFAMPPDVILMLIEHCKEESEERYGKEKAVGFAFIEKQAVDWFNREILTYEQAEQWLQELARRKSSLGRVRRALGISDRALSPTEKRYLTEWLELGFPPESILIAYDRTTTKTGRLTWKYMDSIIRSWDKQGLYAPEAIEHGDKRTARTPGTASAAPAPQDDAKTMEQLARLREKMKNEQ